ncbi:tRNA (adenosine(37)-N6)-threonylcarbamoyltransferase complex dimerization subunit type 1 TsaB [Kordiimonas aquimaris]|uniref:tRNA (adenosine(37)-N6)-threonylcarbamoyltransferase complex dimerization subunit type 1 TsaB n=1 Tax=Kordiimonas aquimaris TaxID=707591 RepID=UPI0021D14A97|nr:tRNA (adenosine(37)-N6)-threonylcarbamoyltransferase complex dimerization subunit type 1 TsaB [Kordiimonas aquimaris]
MLLAIDTSEQTCSAALVDIGDRVVSKRSENIGRGHAERLLPLIGEILAETGSSYNDIKRLAVTTGPGTFTGLRVGLSAARGIALANKIACIGLSGLQVLAAQAQNSAGCMGEHIHAVITGRGGQVFHQAFKGVDEQGMPQPIMQPVNQDADIVAGHMKTLPGLVIGSGRAVLVQAGFEDVLSGVTLENTSVIDPAQLGLMAWSLNPENYRPEPLYLRDADAKKAVPILPVNSAR